MDRMEVMRARHSVRSFTDRQVVPAAAQALRDALDEANREQGLHMQLILDEPSAFSGPLAHYGKLHNVKNYIALVGPKNAQRSIGCGGEQAVLLAQSLGLNTCWVAMTYRRGKVPCTVETGEKLHCVVALGYGTTQGVSHPVKPIEQLCRVDGAMPEWFRRGMEAAQLAPTAMNQQKFLFTLEGTDTVRAKALAGPYTQIDLGIAMCHFALGAGAEGWRWAD